MENIKSDYSVHIWRNEGQKLVIWTFSCCNDNKMGLAVRYITVLVQDISPLSSTVMDHKYVRKFCPRKGQKIGIYTNK